MINTIDEIKITPFLSERISTLLKFGFTIDNICTHVLNYHHWKSLNDNDREKLMNKILGEVA